MVSTRTTTGSIGILANHQPLLAMLEPTELRLYKSESDIVRFAPVPLYNTFADCEAAAARLGEIMAARTYENYPVERALVP